MSIVGLIFSSIYTVAGVSGFVAFLLFGNYPGSVWAFATGIISAFTTQLRWLKFKNRLDDWYSENELSPLSFVGFVCFTLGVMGLAYHIAIEIMLRKSILPINQSEIIPIVWAFMTSKSGLMLMYTARSYANTESDEERSNLIVSDNQEQEQERDQNQEVLAPTE